MTLHTRPVESVMQCFSYCAMRNHSARGTDRGTNQETLEGAEHQGDPAKALVGPPGNLESKRGPGLRRRERRFESCRGHRVDLHQLLPVSAVAV
jgi:hypothetical protein